MPWQSNQWYVYHISLICFATGLHTCTAVARLPLYQLGFLVFQVMVQILWAINVHLSRFNVPGFDVPGFVVPVFDNEPVFRVGWTVAPPPQTQQTLGHSTVDASILCTKCKSIFQCSVSTLLTGRQCTNNRLQTHHSHGVMYQATYNKSVIATACTLSRSSLRF